MVSIKSVEEQLKKIHFVKGWNKSEANELCNVLLPDEEVFECVNGRYEGGFALLCATDLRVLLIDKKPMNILTVEDLRFDTINQIDYSHRMASASICITAGLKSLTFYSYNQPRLRKLISHVQERMAEIKHDEEQARQESHNMADEIDQRLRSYLLAQYEQHQSLIEQHQPSGLPPQTPVVNYQSTQVISAPNVPVEPQVVDTDSIAYSTGASTDELYQEGVKEIFSKYQSAAATDPVKTAVTLGEGNSTINVSLANDGSEEENRSALRIAYSKLPMILRKKRQTLTT